jgi:hypothetical protein
MRRGICVMVGLILILVVMLPAVSAILTLEKVGEYTGIDPFALWGDGTYIYAGGSYNGYALTFNGTNFTELANTGAETIGIWGDGTYLYFSNSTSISAMIFNGSGLTFTVIDSVSFYSAGNRDVWGDGTYIYATDYSASNISAYTFNGTNFELKGVYSLVSTPYSVIGDGTYLYVTDYFGGNLYAFTFNGTGFELKQSTFVGGVTTNVWEDGAHIYVADNDGGAVALTFNGTDFMEIDRTTLETYARDIWGNGTHIYVGDAGAGIMRAYAFDGINFTYIDGSVGGGPSYGVWGDGTYIYEAQQSVGLYAYWLVYSEPPIPSTICPVSGDINNSFNLSADCTLSAGGSTSIGDLVFDCNGYQLIPQGLISNGYTNVTFQNCNISNQDFSSYGLFTSSGSLTLNNIIMDNLTLGTDLIVSTGDLIIDNSILSNMLASYGIHLVNVDDSVSFLMNNTHVENIDGQVVHAYRLTGSFSIENNDWLNTTSMSTNIDNNAGNGEALTIVAGWAQGGMNLLNNNFTDFGIYFSYRPGAFPQVFGCGGAQLIIAGNYFEPTAAGQNNAMIFIQSIQSCPDLLFENNTIYIDEDKDMFQNQQIIGCVQRNNVVTYNHGWRYMWETYNTSAYKVVAANFGTNCSEYRLENNVGLAATGSLTPRYLPVGYPGGAMNVVVRNNTFTFQGLVQINNQYMPMNAEIYDNSFNDDLYIFLITSNVYNYDFNVSVHDNYANASRMTNDGFGSGCSIRTSRAAAITAVQNFSAYNNEIECGYWTQAIRNTSAVSGANEPMFEFYDNTFNIPEFRLTPGSGRPSAVDYPIMMSAYANDEPWQEIPNHVMVCERGDCSAIYSVLVDGQGIALNNVTFAFNTRVNLTGFVLNVRPEDHSSFNSLYENIINYSVNNIFFANLTAPAAYNFNVSLVSGDLHDYTTIYVEQRIPNSSDFADVDWSDNFSAIDADNSTYVSNTNADDGLAYGYVNYSISGSPIGVKIRMLTNNGWAERIIPIYEPDLSLNDYGILAGNIGLRVLMNYSNSRAYLDMYDFGTQVFDGMIVNVSTTEIYEVAVIWIIEDVVPANITISGNLTNGISSKSGVCSVFDNLTSSLGCGFNMTEGDSSGYWNLSAELVDLFGYQSIAELDVLYLVSPPVSSSGSYYFGFEVPPVEGVYEYQVTCSRGSKSYVSSKAFHVTAAQMVKSWITR